MDSARLRYVSIDATTTRASTVSRSMPTNATRIQASMTIPLSRIWSSTSMTLVLVEPRLSSGMVTEATTCIVTRPYTSTVDVESLRYGVRQSGPTFCYLSNVDTNNSSSASSVPQTIVEASRDNPYY